MGKKQLFLMSVLLVLGLTGCGDKVKPASLSDDSAIKAQSEAVIEQSKAVVEESKALEKAKGNNDTVEETEPEKPVSSSKEISHPFMILEYEGEKFDIANDTVKDLVQFWQKTGTHFGEGLSEKLEPYATADTSIHCALVVDWCSASVYNPYNEEIELKDGMIGSYYSGYTMTFEDDTPDNLIFLNGKVNFNSTFKEWMDAFNEEAEIICGKGESIDYEKDEKYIGTESVGDEYSNVLTYDFSNDYWDIRYGFRLDDGRNVLIDMYGDNEKVGEIKFLFDPHYE